MPEVKQEYIRQLTENGLKQLGYCYNKLAHLAFETDHAKMQRTISVCVLEIERILLNEVITTEKEK